jgi:hypothetical protein
LILELLHQRPPRALPFVAFPRRRQTSATTTTRAKRTRKFFIRTL